MATIKELRQRLLRIEQEKARIKSEVDNRARKDELRRKILTGAVALKQADLDPRFSADLHAALDRELTRDQDRILFGQLKQRTDHNS